MVVINVKNVNELQNILKTHKVTIIDVYADWCGPCNRFSPTFTSISNDFKSIEKVAFLKLDIENIDFQEYLSDIDSLPSFLIFRNTKRLKKLSGIDDNTSEQIKREIYAIL